MLLAKLKHPAAADVVKSFERFIDQMERVDVPSLWYGASTFFQCTKQCHHANQWTPSSLCSPLNPCCGAPARVRPCAPRELAKRGEAARGRANSDDFGAGRAPGSWKRSVPSSERPPAQCAAFLERVARQMRETALWCAAMEPEGEVWDATLVAVESFLHRKLRHKLFGQTADDVEGDAELDSRLASLAFIDEGHLDIKSLQVRGVGRGGLMCGCVVERCSGFMRRGEEERIKLEDGSRACMHHEAFPLTRRAFRGTHPLALRGVSLGPCVRPCLLGRFRRVSRGARRWRGTGRWRGCGA